MYCIILYYCATQILLKGHIVAAALQHFNKRSIEDNLPSQVTSDLKQASKNQRKVHFQSIVLQVIGNLVKLPQNPGSQPPDDQQDGVFNYAREVLTYSLLHAEFNDAIREGDGLRVIRCWKVFLLIFRASNRTKYALEAATLLINLQVLPERIQQQMIWSRFVNPSGKPARNIPCDLHMEHLNRTAKTALGQHSHLNPKAVTRVGKCVGLFQNAQKQFDATTDVKQSSGKQVRGSYSTDLHKIVNQLVKSEVFLKKSNRAHASFKKLTHSIDASKWLCAHIKKVQARHRNI